MHKYCVNVWKAVSDELCNLQRAVKLQRVVDYTVRPKRLTMYTVNGAIVNVTPYPYDAQ